MQSFANLAAASSIYGNTGPGEKSTDAPTVVASGATPTSGDKTPAYFWVAFIVVLVAIRVLWELAGEV